MATFRRKNDKVSAVQMAIPFIIRNDEEGIYLSGNAGDWLVTEPDGFTYSLDDNSFKYLFYPTNPNTANNWD